MKNVLENNIREALLHAGFCSSNSNKNFFLVKNCREITGAFHLSIQKRSGVARMSGSIGVYFYHFEDFLSKKCAKVGSRKVAYLLLGMHIDNFVSDLSEDVFEYNFTRNQFDGPASSIFNLCRQVPATVELLSDSICAGFLLNREPAKFISSYKYVDRKSDEFKRFLCFYNWQKDTYMNLFGDFFSEIFPDLGLQ